VKRLALGAAALVSALACPAWAEDGGGAGLPPPPQLETESEARNRYSPVPMASGLHLALLPDAEVPMVSIHVRMPGGVLSDAPEFAGRSALLAAWASRGAGGLSAEQFREAVAARGGRLEIYAGSRWIGIDAEFLAEDAEYGLRLVLDVIRRPTFAPDELRKASSLAVERLKQLRTEPSDAIRIYWDAFLFGGHAFGNPPNGDEASLARLSDADVLSQRWQAVARIPNVWMAVAGDFDGGRVVNLLSEELGGGGDAVAAPVVDAAPPGEGGRVLLVDHPQALQTYFRFGGPGIRRDDPDHAARYLANTILGGRFTSRLNSALRIESGLTYGARSRFDDSRGGAFAVVTYTETATSKECIDLAREVYADFVTEGMTAEELESARAYVKGQFAPDELETPAQRAAWRLDLAISGMSWKFIDGFFDRLDALTLEETNRVITTRFPKDDLCWVVIGQADVLRPIVEPLGKVTEVKLSAPGFGPRE